MNRTSKENELAEAIRSGLKQLGNNDAFTQNGGNRSPWQGRP